MEKQILACQMYLPKVPVFDTFGVVQTNNLCLLYVLLLFSCLGIQFKENPPHIATFFFSFLGEKLTS